MGGDASPSFILYICMTIDGYIAEHDGGVSFLSKYEGVDYGYDKFIETVGVCVMGRKTFEQVVDFPGPWPYPNQRTIVLTSQGTQKELPPNVETHPGPVAALIDQLRNDKTIKGKVWIVGGSQICREFIEANAVDELELYIAPEMLGNGVRLFVTDPKNPDAASQSQPFHLDSVTTLGMGMVRLMYTRAPHPK